MFFLLPFLQILQTSGATSFREEEPGRVMFKNMTILYNGSLEIEDNNLELWKPEDYVEVYLGEYHLQHFALSSWLGFSTSHMAVLFQNPRLRKWFVMDSYAKSAETIANLVMPSIAPNSPLNTMSFLDRLWAYINGDILSYLVWDNAGYVRTHEEKSEEFQDLRHIGTARGVDIINLREWVVNEYAFQNETHPFTFDMWQIYNGSTNERIRKSRMCHDFMEEILGRIKFVKNDDPVYGIYSEEQPESVSTFRDSLNLNVTSWEILDITNAKIRRDYQRFLRFFKNHIYEATRDMSFSRVTVTKMITLGMPFILFLDGNKYVKLGISPYGPVNYCRMPMDFIRGKEYIPAKLDDDRMQCFLPNYDYNEFKESVRFTLADYLLGLEQKIEDVVFGLDGKGGIYFSSAGLIIESTIIIIAVAKCIRWISDRNRKTA